MLRKSFKIVPIARRRTVSKATFPIIARHRVL